MQDAPLKKQTKIHFRGSMSFIYLECWLKNLMSENIKDCYSSLMSTRLEFVIEFGLPDSIITTTKNLVRLFALESGVEV